MHQTGKNTPMTITYKYDLDEESQNHDNINKNLRLSGQTFLCFFVRSIYKTNATF